MSAFDLKSWYSFLLILFWRLFVRLGGKTDFLIFLFWRNLVYGVIPDVISRMIELFATKHAVESHSHVGVRSDIAFGDWFGSAEFIGIWRVCELLRGVRLIVV